MLGKMSCGLENSIDRFHIALFVVVVGDVNHVGGVLAISLTRRMEMVKMGAIQRARIRMLDIFQEKHSITVEWRALKCNCGGRLLVVLHRTDSDLWLNANSTTFILVHCKRSVLFSI